MRGDKREGREVAHGRRRGSVGLGREGGSFGHLVGLKPWLLPLLSLATR